jgi:hypothetical protein
MPIRYRIVRDHKIAYLKGWGKLGINEIAVTGARIFAEDEWENGFSILLDYREVTEMDVHREEIMSLVSQDKENMHLFDKSKCAVVAESDIVFGLSRMWEALAWDIKATKMIFRDIDDAVNWLGLSSDFIDSMNVQP